MLRPKTQSRRRKRGKWGDDRDSNVNDYHLISFSWKMELAFGDEVSLYVERGKIVSGSEANRIFNGIHIVQ